MALMPPAFQRASTALVLVGLWLPGCMTHHESDVERLKPSTMTFDSDKITWPSRYTALNSQIADAMNRTPIIEVDSDGSPTTVLLGQTHDVLEQDRELRYERAFPYGQGVIRVSGWVPDDVINGTRIEFYQWLCEADARTSLQAWNDLADGRSDTMDLEELLVPSVYVLEPYPNTPQLGLAIVLNGYGATRYFIGAAEELRERGWYVLMVPSISLGIALANMSTPIVERYDFQEGPAWFATEFTDKDSAQFNRVKSNELGELIARTHDQRLAVTAYTVEAALQYLAEFRPEVPQHPRMLLAISLGALMAPATVARIGGVDVAVIVTGGANLFGLIRESEYELATRLMGTITRVEYPDSVESDYLIYSQLDPWSIAEVLRDTPTILIQSVNDDAVPTKYGELLWELLGRPDRLDSTLNHVGVLASLRWHMGWLADWVEARLPASDTTPMMSTESIAR